MWRYVVYQTILHTMMESLVFVYLVVVSLSSGNNSLIS